MYSESKQSASNEKPKRKRITPTLVASTSNQQSKTSGNLTGKGIANGTNKEKVLSQKQKREQENIRTQIKLNNQIIERLTEEFEKKGITKQQKAKLREEHKKLVSISTNLEIKLQRLYRVSKTNQEIDLQIEELKKVYKQMI